ncbi:MAG: PAS domain S-box protein [Calditrichaceae bacterium]
MKNNVKTKNLYKRDINSAHSGSGQPDSKDTSIQPTFESYQLVNRALIILSEFNRVLIQNLKETELLSEICRILVETGQYRLAWVGYAENNKQKSVKPAAQFGFEEGYLNLINITWADTEKGRSPAGSAIRNSKITISQNILNDDHFKPWREQALERGYQSSIALPLLANNKAFGALIIYSAKPDAFDEDEVNLLARITADLTLSINAARISDSRRSMEERFRLLFENNPHPMWVYDLESLKFLSVNNAAITHYGYSHDEFLNMTIKDIRPIEDVPALLANIEKVTSGIDEAGLWKHKKKDGSLIDVEIISHTTEFDGKRAEVVLANDVTKRILAESELRASEERFRFIVESAPSILMITDEKGRNIYVSPNCKLITGYSEKDLLGEMKWWVHEDDSARSQLIYEEAFKEHTAGANFEYKASRKNGEVWYASSSWQPIKDEVGQFKGIVFQTIDITERKMAEEAYRKTHESHSLVLNNIDEMIYQIEQDESDLDKGKIIFVSQKVEKILGYQPEDFYNDFQLLISIMHPEDVKKFREDTRNIYEEKKPRIRYYRLRLKASKTYRHIEDSVTPQIDKKDRMIGFFGVARDITDRKMTQEKLRKSEERFRLAFRTSPDAISITTLNKGIYIDINRGFTTITGFTHKEIIGKSSIGKLWVSVDDRNRMAAALKSHKYIDNLEAKFRMKDGTIKTGLMSARIIDLDGEQCVLSITRDITDLNQIRDALRESEKRYELATSAGNVGVWDWNIVTGEIYIDPHLKSILGYKDHEISNRLEEWKKLDYPDDQPNVLAAVNDHLSDKSRIYQIAHRMVHKNGEIRWFLARGNALRDAKGNAYRMVGTETDITETKNLEEQLMQAQKMEAVGRLAGGIAHDFNNLLTVINGYSELLTSRLRKDDPIYREASQIRNAGERAARLTNQLLAFSRRQILQPKVFDINELLREMEKMLGRLIGEDIELITLFPDNVCLIKADPNQIDQVIMNMAVNARDAMPDGGKLIIETQNIEILDDHVKQRRMVEPGLYVRLSLSDTGSGMDKQTQAHIFEPFFTTKEQGKGTGLGLATVYGIIKQSGGYIWLYSEPGQGTTFKIYLPRIDHDMPVLERKEIPHDDVAGTETILVVEDEEDVRNLIVTALHKYGYKVLEAAHGGSALLTCERFKDRIDLLLTDMVMPQMNGKELVERLKPLHPEMSVIYMSGYTDLAAINHELLEDGEFFIQKPFSPVSLIKKIRQKLDS